MQKTQFKKLQQKWYLKLEKHGFNDIETTSERLRDYDRRTINFDNRDLILDFFLRLDTFLTHTQDIPKIHRQILQFYSDGYYITEIITKVHMSRTYIKNTIKQYKIQILK